MGPDAQAPGLAGHGWLPHRDGDMGPGAVGVVGKLGLALRCGRAESKALWDVSGGGVQFVSGAHLLDFSYSCLKWLQTLWGWQSDPFLLPLLH